MALRPAAGLDGLRLLLTTDAVGGVWTYSLDLARGLSARGVQVILVVLGPPPSREQTEEARAIRGIDLLTPGLPLDWTACDLGQLGETIRAVAALARARRADLVHLHAPALADGASFDVPVLATSHSCVRTWWGVVRGGALPPDLAWRAEATGRGCRAVKTLIAPSRAFAELIAEAYALTQTPTVVHNGSALPPERFGADRLPAGENGLPPPPEGRVAGPDLRPASEVEAACFAFSTGRLWDEGKDVSTLDHAAAAADLPVLAAGATTGPNGTAITLEHARALGHLSRVALAAMLRQRPIFVSTAVYEPFGLSVLEAAGHECPLVLADIPTFRELWGGAALFIPPRRPEVLATTLRRLAGDPAERRRLGAAAVVRAADFGLEPFVNGTAAVYRRVLGEATAPEGIAA